MRAQESGCDKECQKNTALRRLLPPSMTHGVLSNGFHSINCQYNFPRTVILTLVLTRTILQALRDYERLMEVADESAISDR